VRRAANDRNPPLLTKGNKNAEVSFRPIVLKNSDFEHNWQISDLYRASAKFGEGFGQNRPPALVGELCAPCK
jgi:hypothetical protein